VAELPDFTFTVHGKPYRIRIGDFTGTEARLFRQAVGMPFIAALGGIASGQVELLEAVAGFKWLVDRKHKKDLAYDDVLETLTYDAVDIEAEVEDEEPDPPQGRPSSLASPPSPPSMGSDLGKLTNSASLS
jgi:hypothetical protein